MALLAAPSSSAACLLAPFSCNVTASRSSRLQSPSCSYTLGCHRLRSLSAALASGAEAAAGEAIDESQFVEVGVIISKHGTRGEVLVKSATDFPEERFEKPGTRWLRVSNRGRKNVIQRVELLGGRNRPGKLPCWLVTLKDISSPEQATALVGATMLVKREDKVPLDEGDFYIPDMIGMDVVIQKTGDYVGIVEDVFSFGAHDMLRVRRISDSHMIWIPFVEAIVPEVRASERRMLIAPPEGLLDLNIRQEKHSSRPSRKEELKARRRMLEVQSGLKKTLAKYNQTHLLACFDKAANEEGRSMLLNELMSIDFRTLIPEFRAAYERSQSIDIRLCGFSEHAANKIGEGFREDFEDWYKQGLSVIARNKFALVSLLTCPDQLRLKTLAERVTRLQQTAVDAHRLGECRITWIILTRPEFVERLSTIFEAEQHFGLDAKQVYVLEQETRPIFAKNGEHCILRQTQWQIAQSHTGMGAAVSILSSKGILDDLLCGVEYLQVCDAGQEAPDVKFLGFAHEHLSDLSIKATSVEPGKDVIGFLKRAADKYDLTKLSALQGCRQDLMHAMTPLDSYLLSASFLKNLLADSGFEFELQTRLTCVPCYDDAHPVQQNALLLEYSLLDCLPKCQPHKVSILHTQHEQ